MEEGFISQLKVHKVFYEKEMVLQVEVSPVGSPASHDQF